MFFKLQHNITNGEAICALKLLRCNSYVNKTLSDGSVIKARDEAEVDTLGTTTFSLSIPENENRIFKYINNSAEMEEAKQFLLDQLEN